jgi:hypothetical protein
MSDRREKLKRLGKKVLGGAKTVGLHLLKYGLPLAAAAYVGHERGRVVGKHKGWDQGYNIGKEVATKVANDRIAVEYEPQIRAKAQQIADLERQYDQRYHQMLGEATQAEYNRLNAEYLQARATLEAEVQQTYQAMNEQYEAQLAAERKWKDQERERDLKDQKRALMAEVEHNARIASQLYKEQEALHKGYRATAAAQTLVSAFRGHKLRKQKEESQFLRNKLINSEDNHITTALKLADKMSQLDRLQEENQNFRKQMAKMKS